jgi:hypothetical protein
MSQEMPPTGPFEAAVHIASFGPSVLERCYAVPKAEPTSSRTPSPNRGSPCRMGNAKGALLPAAPVAISPICRRPASPSSVPHSSSTPKCYLYPLPTRRQPQAPPSSAGLKLCPACQSRAPAPSIGLELLPVSQPQACPEHRLRSNAGRTPELVHPRGTTKVAGMGWGRLLCPQVWGS